MMISSASASTARTKLEVARLAIDAVATAMTTTTTFASTIRPHVSSQSAGTEPASTIAATVPVSSSATSPTSASRVKRRTIPRSKGARVSEVVAR